MEEEKIIIDDLMINYKIFGAKTNPPVLILHGWGIGSDAWIETAEKLPIGDIGLLFLICRVLAKHHHRRKLGVLMITLRG